MKDLGKANKLYSELWINKRVVLPYGNSGIIVGYVERDVGGSGWIDRLKVKLDKDNLIYEFHISDIIGLEAK